MARLFRILSTVRFSSSRVVHVLTRVTELYPYFRFLGVHWAEDYNEFCKKFGDIEKVALLSLELRVPVSRYLTTYFPRTSSKSG